MHDEFLTSLRRQPPARFARELQRKLQAQEAEARRRSWSLWTRTIAFLIVGSAAFAGGFLVSEHRSAGHAGSGQSQSQSAPESKAASPDYRPPRINPTFVPEGSDTNAFHASRQSSAASTTSGGSAQARRATDVSNAAPNTPAQTASGELIRTPQSRVRVATSPLTDALVRRRVLRSDAPTVEVETMEADSAFAALCMPRGEAQFDMVVTSRRMISTEFANCQDNAGANISELKLGYQALVLTSARDSVHMKLTLSDVYLAVAKQVSVPMEPERFIPNPHITWDQIDNLEYRPIQVFGPARGTPRRTLFEILLLEPGCNANPAIKALESSDPERHADLCHSLRSDRAYVEVEQNSVLIPQYLWSDPNPLVLVDYQFYRDNRGQLAGSAIEGPEPSYATIADGSYPLARPVYLYADRARTARSRQAYTTMSDLERLWIIADPSFVELDEREAREQRTRRMRNVSESDLNNK